MLNFNKKCIFSLSFSVVQQAQPDKKAWPDQQRRNLQPPADVDRHGSVQVMSSTNGELGPDDFTAGQSHAPIHPPEVDVVEDTK